MEHPIVSPNTGNIILNISLLGFSSLCYYIAKVNASTLASWATVGSFLVVLLVNLPKLIEIYYPKITSLYNKLFKRK